MRKRAWSRQEIVTEKYANRNEIYKRISKQKGQTVQTCFRKHRQTSERKELWATKLPRVPQQFQHGGICDEASRMREPNLFDTPGQRNQTSPNKHDNQRNV